MLKDKEYSPFRGYNGNGYGDSGGPIWTKASRDGNKELDSEEVRHTIVAVNSLGYGFHRIHTVSKFKKIKATKSPFHIRSGVQGNDKCLNIGTKLTVDIIEWIKEMDRDTPTKGTQNTILEKSKMLANIILIYLHIKSSV